jgi:hypothetical protein
MENIFFGKPDCISRVGLSCSTVGSPAKLPCVFFFVPQTGSSQSPGKADAYTNEERDPTELGTSQLCLPECRIPFNVSRIGYPETCCIQMTITYRSFRKNTGTRCFEKLRDDFLPTGNRLLANRQTFPVSIPRQLSKLIVITCQIRRPFSTQIYHVLTPHIQPIVPFHPFKDFSFPPYRWFPFHVIHRSNPSIEPRHQIRPGFYRRSPTQNAIRKHSNASNSHHPGPVQEIRPGHPRQSKALKMHLPSFLSQMIERDTPIVTHLPSSTAFHN